VKRECFLDFNWLALKIHNDFFRSFSGRLSGTVVDLGSGAQLYRDDIRSLGCKYVSVDWSNSYHEVRPDVVADLNVGVDLPDSFADCVIGFSVLEHLYRPERLIQEAQRILKPGGSLYMQVPFQWAVHEAPYDYVRFTRFGLEKLFEGAGFKNISINADCGYWVTAALKLNYHARRLLRGPRGARWLIQAVLTPFWIAGQAFASLADRLDFDENETASYTVRAEKLT
jgi:SAM-dependent methyltransferase